MSETEIRLTQQLNNPSEVTQVIARMGRPNLPSYQVTVVKSLDVAGNMRRVILALPEDLALSYQPGQAVVMMIPTADGEVGRREYTIRSHNLDSGTIAIDFFIHGDTPGPRWARDVKAGDSVEIKGPKGRTVFNAEADWHLFTGDESCIPAIAHILETLPQGTKAFAFIEVQDALSEILIESKADVALQWLHRGDAQAASSALMVQAVADFVLPEGKGHAYIIGETSTVRKQRHDLIERGFGREQISSEGYWRPGRIGGHDHVND